MSQPVAAGAGPSSSVAERGTGAGAGAGAGAAPHSTESPPNFWIEWWNETRLLVQKITER